MPKIKDYTVPLPDISMEMEKLVQLTETCSRLIEIIQDKVWDDQESYPESMWSRWMDARRDLSVIMGGYESCLYDIEQFSLRYTGQPQTENKKIG